jgi:tRNA U34 2-thiouridine synthase MnmA/TrmU
MSPTAVALVSGGLDSRLALAVTARQGVEVIALHACHVFHAEPDTPEHRAALDAVCRGLGARETVFREITPEMIELTKHPAHGTGQHLNACLDCRLLVLRCGAELLRERGADFLVTGEVPGQRPMSQRRDALRLAERRMTEWGLEGRLLRPLGAQLLPETLPEREGWVDRAGLHAFQGRTRKPQMALAEALGVRDYPSPAGGCLLTDPGFSVRLGDLMAHEPAWGARDVELCKIGRHYRIDPETKILASRREEENRRLRETAPPDAPLFITEEKPGAIVAVLGRGGPDAGRIAAGLAVHFSKFRRGGAGPVRRFTAPEPEGEGRSLGVTPRVDPAELPGPPLGSAAGGRRESA